MMKPLVQVHLKLIHGSIEGVPESLTEKLVQDSPVEPFHETVGLWPCDLRFPVLDVMKLKEDLMKYLE